MTFNQPVTQLIRQRVSCRTYQETPIAKSTRQKLDEFIRSCQEGPMGSRSRFILAAASAQDNEALQGLRTYGFIKGATGFIIGAMGPGAMNLEDYGYLLESIILFTTDLDLGSCWLGGTFTKSRFAKKISVGKEETLPAVASLGYPAEKPSAMDLVSQKSAGAHKRLPWDSLFFEADFGTPLSPEHAGEYSVPLEMVRLGPSASNKQPWRVVKEGPIWHFYMQRTKGYRGMMLARLTHIADMQRIDMGIAMCHFELTVRELELSGRWERQHPGIALPDDLTEYTISWVSE